MSEFHFLRPEWLWLLIPWLLILPWLRAHFLKRGNWEDILAPHLSQILLQGGANKTPKWPFYALAAGLLITILALSGPSWQRVEVPLFNQDQGAVLVLDASMQTRAQDTNPDRFTRLSFKATDIVNQFNSGQLGLIAYAGDAFTVTPLTRDAETILQSLKVLTPEIMPIQGRDPLLAMQEADRLLTAAGYSAGEILWLTSGIDQRDMEDLRRFFRENNHRVSILAAGTTEGAPIRDTEGELLRDSAGRVILARLVPEYLERISAETGGRYTMATVDSSDVVRLLDFSQYQGDVAESLEQGEQWHDAAPWLLLLLIPLVLLASRKGVLWSFVLILFVVPEPVVAQQSENATQANTGGNTSAGAQNNDSSDSTTNATEMRMAPWRLPFQNREQFADSAFAAGDYLSAAANYESPMAQGMAWYRAGEYANAAASYSAVDTPEGSYNLGNALAKLGELAAALNAYEDALTARPDWPEARENYELVKALLEQQAENESGEGEESNNDENGEPDAENSEANQQNENDNENGESNQSAQSEQENNENQAENEERENSEQDNADAETEARADEESMSEAEARAAQLEAMSAEEAEELEQLLRRVDDDPALLLRNRLLLEAQRRRSTRPPRGN
ncbi:vWA domain-containing protein [Aliidiomarina iranensis]|nr:VWA domain-containing protein [Aliidiomarina iranensis]